MVCVLTQEYFIDKGIPGTISIPHTDEFASNIQRLYGSKTVKIILYCAHSECSASHKAAEELIEKGWPQESVMVYTPGAEGWLNHN